MKIIKDKTALYILLVCIYTTLVILEMITLIGWCSLAALAVAIGYTVIAAIILDDNNQPNGLVVCALLSIAAFTAISAALGIAWITILALIPTVLLSFAVLTE